MPENLYNSVYNPDVLSCLANLSNDEVFTPPSIANAMLDMLPQDLFKNPDTKFLDPACKSGVFLREIAKRLLKGLEPQIPDLQKRVDHIMHHQLFGIAITEMTSLLARRSLYCSKYPNSKYSVSLFNDADGNVRFKNIQHTWNAEGKCKFCGVSQKTELGSEERGKSLEAHAYEFIHTNNPQDILNMKFDVIISNPPYQMNDGGSGTGISAIPIYQYFVRQAKKLNPKYLTMIIPSRWFAGGKGLDEFREEMLHDRHIRQLVDYPKSRDCFPGVDIAGGVCYFLWTRDEEQDCKVVSRTNNKENIAIRELNEFDIFIRDNLGIKIIHKVKSLLEDTMDKYVFSRNPFGFVSSDRGKKQPFQNAIKLVSSEGVGYVSLSDVTKNMEQVSRYKVIVGKVNPDRGGVNNAVDGKMNVITKIRILSPNTVFTETYLLLGCFDSRENAVNCASYFASHFVRYLISLTLTSMNITKDNFCFVPMQDFSKPWTDAELYEKYGITQEEQEFIDSMIKPMDLSGGADDGE